MNIKANLYLILLLFFLNSAVPSYADDQVLIDLVRQGLAGSPEVEVLRARMRSAVSDIKTARWQFWPTPSLSFETAATQNDDPAYQGDDFVTIFSLQQPLWTGGRLSAGLDRAEAAARSASQSLEETKVELANSIILTYGEWLSSWLEYLAWERSVAAHERLLAQIERRVDSGVSRRNDLDLARSRLNSVRTDLSSSFIGRQNALARLQQLIGSAVDEQLLISTLTKSKALPVDVDTAIQSAEKIAPSIRRSKEELQRVQAELRELESSKWPEVFLRFEHQYGNYSFISSAGDTSNRLFLGTRTQFGAGLSTLSQINGAQAQLQAAQAEIDANRLLIAEQVTRNYMLAHTSEKQIAMLTDVIQSSKAVLESYRRQFLVKGKTWLEVMNAERELALNEVQLADADATLLITSWQLAVYSNGLIEVMRQTDG